MIFCINIVSFIRLCDPFGKSCIETIRKNKGFVQTTKIFCYKFKRCALFICFTCLFREKYLSLPNVEPVVFCIIA